MGAPAKVARAQRVSAQQGLAESVAGTSSQAGSQARPGFPPETLQSIRIDVCTNLTDTVPHLQGAAGTCHMDRMAWGRCTHRQLRGATPASADRRGQGRKVAGEAEARQAGRGLHARKPAGCSRGPAAFSSLQAHNSCKIAPCRSKGASHSRAGAAAARWAAAREAGEAANEPTCSS